MVLAAGLGMRMRPLTLDKPKPLLEIGGRTMLDHTLDRLVAHGIKRAVVNVHYLADQIEDHLANRYDIEIIISGEPELLDTGGGIKNVLAHFEDRPFFAINADLPWTEGPTPSLERMAKIWHPDKMDALLLLMQTGKARGFEASGNFFMNADGQLRRKDTQPPRPYVMISAQILTPQLFSAIPGRIFSNNRVWDDAESRGRLYGLEHDGACYHVGTPGDWQVANALLASGQGWAVP
jgi:MurNAc alpha-1-phosphate uridylyltransferase